MKWATVTLGEIAQFRNGLNYTKMNFGRGLKVINVKDFQNHLTLSSENLDEINPDGIVREESLLREGDIVFVRSNGKPLH
jgi:type I restriction enzyme, S subunit